MRNRDVQWTPARGLALGAAAVVGLLLLAEGGYLLWGRVVGRAAENVRHDVFKGSQAYRDGVVLVLNKRYLEYSDPSTSPDHRAAIRTVTLQDLGDYPASELPEHLRTWVRSLQDPKQGSPR